jgi:hypothetical protein
MNDQSDYGTYQQQVNQETGDVEHQESAKPKDKQEQRYA